jgi:hypothetical protein
MKYYVLGIWGDVEPLPLQGPYETEQERDDKAREIVVNNETDEGGIYRLNVDEFGNPSVESYGHLELHPEDEENSDVMSDILRLEKNIKDNG